ncbi:hypothetical protein L1D14_07355 [Vibrio tubiashii]|uniref:hypothetical protein n=1 Tax=Vibrio tubiashii TaxID=29498 RepID=UPI001EFE7196|nr:hypothetical protein [Vibrio tubiashii]MCG9576054.1 hypothetical protein [Vibrio tubiashii]
MKNWKISEETDAVTVSNSTIGTVTLQKQCGGAQAESLLLKLALDVKRGNIQHTPSEAESDMLTRFFNTMKNELAKNSHKGDMATEWVPDAYQIISEVAYHHAKFTAAMLSVERQSCHEARYLVDEYSADVANILAKASSVFGAKNHPLVRNDTLGHPYEGWGAPLAGENGVDAHGMLVRILDTGTICWDVNDPREPIHNVTSGDEVWLYDLKQLEDGGYTHVISDMSPESKIETTSRLEVCYMSWDPAQDTVLFDRTNSNISPDYT